MNKPTYAILAVLAVAACVYWLCRDRPTTIAPRAKAATEVTIPEQLRALLGDGRAKASANDLLGALDSYDAAAELLTVSYRKVGEKGEPLEMRKLYGEVIGELDKLVDRLETPEYEAKIPQRDMLSPGERGQWGKSAGVETACVPGGIQLTSLDVRGNKITGIVSLGGSDPPWRDLILDLNFTIVSGGFQLFLRYSPGNPSFVLSFDTRSGYELNKPYEITLRVKGSRIELFFPDLNPQSDTLMPSTNRTGGIGFGLAPGSKVEISSCKLKVLRLRGP